MNPAKVWAQLLANEKKLTRAGFPAISPWWLAQLHAFICPPKGDDGNAAMRRSSFVARVGRRGGKSSTMARLAVAIATAGEHGIPKGDVGQLVFVSVSRDEAAARLRTIAEILDALGISHRMRAADEIELTDRPILFRVLAASWRTAVGFTGLALFCDEVARWRDADDGANPASQVIAAMKPSLLTTKGWLFLVSSPLANVDFHAEQFDRGTTDDQVVAHAASWVANPTITEAETHALERDRRLWAREYGAIPQPAIDGVFDPDDVVAAFRKGPALDSMQRVIVVDPSSGKRDMWAAGVCGIDLDREDKNYLVFDQVRWWDPAQAKALGADGIVATIAAIAREHGITRIYGDQRDSFTLKSLVQSHGLYFHELPWTSTSKPQAVERLRRRFKDKTVLLPDVPKLHDELLNFTEIVTPNGQFTFGARGAGHDDLVALLVTAAMSEIERRLYVRPQVTNVPPPHTFDFDDVGIGFADSPRMVVTANSVAGPESRHRRIQERIDREGSCIPEPGIAHALAQIIKR
jgi:hypothetical protein